MSPTVYIAMDLKIPISPQKKGEKCTGAAIIHQERVDRCCCSCVHIWPGLLLSVLSFVHLASHRADTYGRTVVFVGQPPRSLQTAIGEPTFHSFAQVYSIRRLPSVASRQHAKCNTHLWWWRMMGPMTSRRRGIPWCECDRVQKCCLFPEIRKIWNVSVFTWLRWKVRIHQATCTFQLGNRIKASKKPALSTIFPLLSFGKLCTLRCTSSIHPRIQITRLVNLFDGTLTIMFLFAEWCWLKPAFELNLITYIIIGGLISLRMYAHISEEERYIASPQKTREPNRVSRSYNSPSGRLFHVA